MKKFSSFPLYSILFFIFVFLDIGYLIDIIRSTWHAYQHGWVGYLNTNVRVMQNIIFFYAFLYLILSYLFKQELKIQFILFVIPFAFWEVEYNVFSELIHPLLFKTHFYHLFTSLPQNISPEYTRIVFFVLILMTYVIQSCFKKSFANIFLSLSMGGILGTAILFHTVTLAQLNYYTEHQKETFQQLYLENNKDLLKNKCQFLHIECHIYLSSDNPFDDKQPPIVEQYKEVIEPQFIQYPNYFFYVVSNDNHIADRISSRKPIAVLKNQYFSVIIIDQVNYTSYLNFNQTIFGILAFTSHIVWLLGALYLIYFHQKRRRKTQIVSA